MANPPPKRLRLSTPHQRNGGQSTSYIVPPACDGSDTEDENDEQVNQHFLAKMNSVQQRRGETVFGAGINVWKSQGGTMHADVDDKTKKKRKAEQIQDGGKMERDGKGSRVREKILKEEMPLDTGITMGKAGARAKALSLGRPESVFRVRKEDDTRFYHGSAGLDPLGAYNRPVHAGAGSKKNHQVLPRGVISGSFGSFESGVSRFDDREYRLLPKENDRGKESDSKERVVGGRKLDLFKGKPWLRC